MSELPALQQKTVPFIGEEAEGPHQGDQVLFIPGTTELMRYRRVRYKLPDVKGIYYGAGNCRGVSSAVFQFLAEDARDHNLHLTVETDRFRLHWLKWQRDRFKFIVVCFDNFLNTEALLGIADYHKTIEGDKITWIKVDDPRTKYITPIDSPLFALDQDVPLGD